MKEKILLFSFCFTANIYCQEFNQNSYNAYIQPNLPIIYAIKCPKKECMRTFIGDQEKRLAFLILNHIYSDHSHPALYQESTNYVEKNATKTQRGKLNMKCPMCKKDFYAKTISGVVNLFITHRFATQSHNMAGFRNMLEYIYQSGDIEE